MAYSRISNNDRQSWYQETAAMINRADEKELAAVSDKFDEHLAQVNAFMQENYNCDIRSDWKKLTEDKKRELFGAYKENFLQPILEAYQQFPTTDMKEKDHFAEMADQLEQAWDEQEKAQFAQESYNVAQYLPLSTLDFPALVKQYIRFLGKELMPIQTANSVNIEQRIFTKFLVNNQTGEEYEVPRIYFEKDADGTPAWRKIWNAGKGWRLNNKDVLTLATIQAAPNKKYSLFQWLLDDAGNAYSIENEKNVRTRLSYDIKIKYVQIAEQPPHDEYTVTTSKPEDWDSAYTSYYTKGEGDKYTAVTSGSGAPEWTADTYYSRTPVVATVAIWRYMVTGTLGSVYQIQKESGIAIPEDYYNEGLYIVPEYTAQNGGVKIAGGSTGFFDEYEDGTMNSETFKWLYSKLLVDAYRGRIDTRISSTTRVPAKFLFDGGTNTIVGITMLPYMTYSISDIAQASTIFSDEEKQEILLSDDILVDPRISASDDIDVKTAMYDLMIERVYQGMPEEKRPEGPGFGLSLHLDAGECDATTARLVDASFAKKFTNPNASWDIGGYVYNGITYTYVNRLVNNFFTFFRANSINKPYTNSYTAFSEYTSFFPDIDSADWELRELMYNSGGNVWIPDENNRLVRKSQRTLNREVTGTSDIIQESNMRTLSQFCTILQGIIDDYLLEYSDPGVIKTLEEDCNTTFSPWIGDRVQDLSIKFETDTNIDGGDILVCRTGLKFRRLILRAAIIVDLQRRDS